MDLTPTQRRTLERLIGLGVAPAFDPDLAGRIRSRLERAMEAVLAADGDPIWLGKGLLNDRQRCEGLFQASLFREGPVFEYGPRTAAGALFHKAIEVDALTERELDPRTVCERSAANLNHSDPRFEALWTGLDRIARAELLAEAGRRVDLFRASFPPLSRRWAPQTELRLKVRLLGGRVVLSGAPDLALGRTRKLLLDFKTGKAWPEHPEDMRFYALVLLLRTGVAPYRVATFFLDSGEWQPEDVTEETLEHAAGRVLETVRTADCLSSGGVPGLRPGQHCGWCPRRTVCPAVAGQA
jgi:PD-(D/E)XK nuclease superfamily